MADEEGFGKSRGSGASTIFHLPPSAVNDLFSIFDFLYSSSAIYDPTIFFYLLSSGFYHTSCIFQLLSSSFYLLSSLFCLRDSICYFKSFVVDVFCIFHHPSVSKFLPSIFDRLSSISQLLCFILYLVASIFDGFSFMFN